MTGAPEEARPGDGDTPGSGALRLAGLALLVLGLAVNEWTVARVASEDGRVELATRVGVWAFQAGALVLGSFLAVTRGVLPGGLRDGASAARLVLGLGILLRVLVHLFLEPANNDPHQEFIDFIVENGRLPIADEVLLGFQPPLYYVLAAPLMALAGSAKVVQLLSLALSIANLFLLHRLIATTRLLESARARLHALLLAALLPQLLFFGGFVSNDALAFPLGTLGFLVALRYAERPGRGRLVALAFVVGLGLLTKGTLLVALPAFSLLVLAVELRRAEAGRRVAAVAGSLLLFWLVGIAVGSYKFVENTIHFGSPVVSNEHLGQDWVDRQPGPTSLLDVDVTKLVRHPFLGEETWHSVPLLMYGTFWYGYIDQESSFTATRRYPLTYLPRAIYALGIVPTLCMVLGLVAWARRARSLAKLRDLPREDFAVRALETAVVLSLLGSIALVLRWGLQHDAWSFFQSRLVFPSFLGIALLYGRGAELVTRRDGVPAALASLALAATYAALLAYLFVELVYAACGPVG